jgi:hypothetical protein
MADVNTNNTDVINNDMDLITINDMDDTHLVLSTIDNPFNPHDDYDKWKDWDEDNGYYTEAFVARLLDMEGDFDVDDDVKIKYLTDKVIKDILDNDVTNHYILI